MEIRVFAHHVIGVNQLSAHIDKNSALRLVPN